MKDGEHFFQYLLAAYEASQKYTKIIQKLGRLHGKRPIYLSDVNELNEAYSQVKSAQWNLNNALDGGMTDSKN